MSTSLAASTMAASMADHLSSPTVSGLTTDASVAAAALTPATLPCFASSALLASYVSQLEAAIGALRAEKGTGSARASRSQ